MSNFGVTYLLKVNKGNNRLSIEDNIGEEIHVHFGEIRLMLRNEQFREFAKQTLSYIAELTDISVDVLERLDPIFLFDLCRRGELPSLTLQHQEYVSVGELLCPVRNKIGIWRYKPIRKSHFIGVLKKKTMATPFDADQVNYYGKTNGERCEDVLNLCKNNKDICDTYPLYVTANNIIRDGQHRAAALYLLYGHDFKVKIQRMETNRSGRLLHKTPEDFLKDLLRPIVSKIRKMQEKRYNRKDIVAYTSCIKNERNLNAFDIIRNDKTLGKEVYFVEANFALSDFPVLIKKQQSDLKTIKALLSRYKFRMIPGHGIEGITFIYGLGEDYLIVDERNKPIAFFQDKISSYAMSVNSFMPYAPEIQRFLVLFEEIPETLLYVLRLLKCMFDKKKNGFFESDIMYFNEHKYLLDSSFFEKEGLIDKVLFGYSDRMIELLRQEKYSQIIDDYRRFEY